MKVSKTRRLTESAMLLALAIVLELAAKLIIPELPFGGQITFAAMLPVVVISWRHGLRWGFVAAFTYALLEMAIGMKTVSAAFLPGYFGAGAMIAKALLMCGLDYVAAYTVLGLGGIFRKAPEPGAREEHPGRSLLLGSVVALSARYLMHILSGYILFADYAAWFFTQDGFPGWGQQLVDTLSPTALALAYSAVYNGMYMLPEILVTALLSLPVARLLSRKNGIS